MAILRAIWSGAWLLLGRAASPIVFTGGVFSLFGIGAFWIAAVIARDLGFGGTLTYFNTVALLTQIGTWPLIALVVALFAGQHHVGRRRSLVVALLAGGAWLALVEGSLGLLLGMLPVGPLLDAISPPESRPGMEQFLTYQRPLLVLPLTLLLLLPLAFAAVRSVWGLQNRLRAIALWLCLGLFAVALPSPFIMEPMFGFAERNLSPHLRQLAFYTALEQGWLPLPPSPAIDEEEPDTTLPYDPESVLAYQDALLARDVAQVAPQRPSKRDLYTISFAGYGAQAVFKREVDKVDTILADRVAGPRHGLRLISHADTIATTPLASARNLRIALGQLAKIMDPKQDVLFLFMTSHGNAGNFSVRLQGMPFENLRPKQLRKLLDDAGIIHRVILLSACYSGSFIKALANDDTLIITAAREDRSSFGCADENEWTWFGNAYFNHALRETRSFIEAFGKAKVLIGEWEIREKVTPSEPQIAIGKRIAATLAELTPATVQ